MDAHVLAEVIVSAEVLPAPRVRALVSYKRKHQHRRIRNNNENIRFSYVCILLTCLFKCSPLAKHLPQPSTSQRYILALRPPAPCRFLPAPLAALRRSSRLDIVGTLRPRDF